MNTLTIFQIVCLPSGLSIAVQLHGSVSLSLSDRGKQGVDVSF
jgi:hypothetical protein